MMNIIIQDVGVRNLRNKVQELLDAVCDKSLKMEQEYSYKFKAYNALPWYKRIFSKYVLDPSKIDDIHSISHSLNAEILGEVYLIRSMRKHMLDLDELKLNLDYTLEQDSNAMVMLTPDDIKLLKVVEYMVKYLPEDSPA